MMFLFQIKSVSLLRVRRKREESLRTFLWLSLWVNYAYHDEQSSALLERTLDPEGC